MSNDEEIAELIELATKEAQIAIDLGGTPLEQLVHCFLKGFRHGADFSTSLLHVDVLALKAKIKT